MSNHLTEKQLFFKLAGVRRRCDVKPVFKSSWVKKDVESLECESRRSLKLKRLFVWCEIFGLGFEVKEELIFRVKVEWVVGRYGVYSSPTHFPYSNFFIQPQNPTQKSSNYYPKHHSQISRQHILFPPLSFIFIKPNLIIII